MPSSPAIASLLADYKGDASLAEGEVFDAAAAAIEKRVERLTLANGMKVALLPKKTRGSTVQMALRIGYGDEATRAGKYAVDELATSLIMRGARGLNRQQINDTMDRLRASGGLGLGGGAFQTKKTYLPELLGFVGKLYSTASFPADELEIVRKESITAIEEQSKDPESVAFTALERHFSHYPRGDARYVPTVVEHVADLKAVTRDQVLRYATAMRGLSAAEIAIVGDFDVPAVKSALQNAFATSKLATPFRRVNREHKPVALKAEKLSTPDKENTTFVARVAFPLQDKADDYPALMLADYIIGGSGGARLFLRVREKEGLSYDVFSNLSVPTFSNNATWSFGFIANPQNTAKAEASLRDELLKILAGAVTEDEFNAQRQALIDQRLVRRSQDAGLAAVLVTLTDADRTFDFTQNLEDRMLKLTKADFDAVVNKYIKLSEMSSFVAGDFAKVK
jgi:zinc protease